jgi:hypothetical protein
MMILNGYFFALQIPKDSTILYSNLIKIIYFTIKNYILPNSNTTFPSLGQKDENNTQSIEGKNKKRPWPFAGIVQFWNKA